MGYNDDGIVKVDQEFFEPFDRREIQVVGRLIEEQDVRVSKKCLSKKDFDLLAVRSGLPSVCNEDRYQCQVRSEE